MTPCINSENYDLMRQIREFSITYCTYFEVSNGRIGTFQDELIDKVIACFEKILYNRLFIQESCNQKPRTFTENLHLAEDILAGKIVDDRLSSIIKRIYTE